MLVEYTKKHDPFDKRNYRLMSNEDIITYKKSLLKKCLEKDIKLF